MEKYIEILVGHEIDVDTLSTMTDQDLKEIGITTFGNIYSQKDRKVDRWIERQIDEQKDSYM